MIFVLSFLRASPFYTIIEDSLKLVTYTILCYHALPTSLLVWPLSTYHPFNIRCSVILLNFLLVLRISYPKGRRLHLWNLQDGKVRNYTSNVK